MKHKLKLALILGVEFVAIAIVLILIFGVVGSLFLTHTAQKNKCVVKSAHLVNDPVFHSLVPLNDRAAIGCNLIGTHHQFLHGVGLRP